MNPIDEAELGEEEEQEVDQDKVLREVLLDHLGLDQAQDENDNNNIVSQGPICSVQDTKKALKLLIEFTESQDDIQTTHLRAIEKLEQDLEAIDLNNCTQSTLDSWLM